MRQRDAGVRHKSRLVRAGIFCSRRRRHRVQSLTRRSLLPCPVSRWLDTETRERAALKAARCDVISAENQVGHAATAGLSCRSCFISCGGGSIISIASGAGISRWSMGRIYSAPKPTLIHLSRCVASEMGEHSVRLNTISPGAIVTSILPKRWPARNCGRPVHGGHTHGTRPIRRRRDHVILHARLQRVDRTACSLMY
jgi:NAD(P)-dependent dehydrogenase (short-subunit alcohol dehydrogenase family)